jgi:hypothetical protein
MSTFFIDLVGSTDEARREFETSSKVLDIVANGLPLTRIANCFSSSITSSGISIRPARRRLHA